MNTEKHEIEKRGRIGVKVFGLWHGVDALPPAFVQMQREVVEPVTFEPQSVVRRGLLIPIDQIIYMRSAASQKGGGFGTLYRIRIRAEEFNLFNVGNEWFIEEKDERVG